MLCHPEPGSAVSYALQNAKSRITFRQWNESNSLRRRVPDSK